MVSENLKIINFSLNEPGHMNLSIFIDKRLIPFMGYFIDTGVFASRSELIRRAIKELIIKLVHEDSDLKKFKEIKQFNASQRDFVIVEGKKYKLGREMKNE